MKKTIIAASALFLLFACKKSEHQTGTYKVKYTVTGSTVNQFKITVDSSDKTVYTPFTGSRDTTIYVSGGSTLKLDAKADGVSALAGTIFVNDAMVANGSDPDTDGDNKTEVKISYAIPK